MTPVDPSSGGNAQEPAADDETVALAALNCLAASEQKLEFVFDRGSRRFLKLSGPCEEFFALTREQLLADPEAWTRAVEALDRDSVKVLREDLKRLGNLVRILHVTGRDGCKRALRASVMLHQMGDRSVVVGSVVDIETGTDAQGWSSVLQAAMEEAHEGIAVTDAEGRYLYLNREHITLFGYDSMDELIGKSWRVLYSDEVLRHFEQAVFPKLQATGRWQGRMQAKRKDGSFFHEEITLSLRRTGGIVCNCRDVSDEVQLRERLERSEAMFRVFLNTLPTGVTIRNLTGEYEFLNDATTSFPGRQIDQSGQPRGMNVGRSEEKAFASWGAVDERVATTGASQRFDFPLTWGGREWVLDVEKLPLRIGSAGVTHVCTLVNDVTAARRLEAESADIARRRDEYLVMQREFISMVSHEFRTPLTAIQGLQYLMAKSLTGGAEPGPAKFMRWLDLQGQALGTLKELVDQVLLLNRIEHLASAVPQHVALGAFLAKIMEGIAASLENQRLRIELDLPAGFTALLDEGQMRALVENLVSNGLKYSSDVVTVQAGVHENHWCLSVADRGRGIPQKDQAKLFQPFFRAGNIGNVTGTGLGLTIVQRCAAFHGGTVELESREGAGTKFTVKFPRKFPVPSPALPYMEPGQTADPFGVNAAHS